MGIGDRRWASYAPEDGYSLIQKIRSSSSEKTRVTPAIALTAYTRSEDRNRALQAGFDLHTGKPADPSALVNMVATLAGRGAGADRAASS